MAKISKEKDRSQAVILPARSFCFEIKAILTCPWDLANFVPCCVGKS